MIKITNAYFERISTPLFVAVLQKTWPLRTAYQLARIVEHLQTEGKPYFQLKEQLIQEYGKKDEAGNVIAKNGSVSIENINEFNEKMQELQAIELTIDVPKMHININADSDCSAEEMLMLAPIMDAINE